jgi:hypothetical protein
MGMLPRSIHNLVKVGLLIPSLAAHAGMVLTGTLGANSREHFRGGHFAYSLAAYAKFDEQTLLGIQSGQGSVTGLGAIPITGSALVRLPLGRIVMPVASGDIGYAIHGDRSGFLWRAGGGFDIRNGRHSSLLALGAYEQVGSRSGWLARVGLLLEF